MYKAGLFQRFPRSANMYMCMYQGLYACFRYHSVMNHRDANGRVGFKGYRLQPRAHNHRPMRTIATTRPTSKFCSRQTDLVLIIGSAFAQTEPAGFFWCWHRDRACDRQTLETSRATSNQHGIAASQLVMSSTVNTKNQENSSLQRRLRRPCLCIRDAAPRWQSTPVAGADTTPRHTQIFDPCSAAQEQQFKLSRISVGPFGASWIPT